MFVTEQYPSTGANNVAAIFCQHAILKIMFVRLAGHDLVNIFFIGGAIIRVDFFHPSISYPLHIFVRQAKIANSLFRPAGPICSHIGDIGVCPIRKYRKSLIQGINFRFDNAIHHFLLLIPQRSSCRFSWLYKEPCQRERLLHQRFRLSEVRLHRHSRNDVQLFQM